MVIRYLTLHVEKRGDAEELLEELKGAPGVYEAILQQGVDPRSAKYFMKVDEEAIEPLKRYGTPTVLARLDAQA